MVLQGPVIHAIAGVPQNTRMSRAAGLMCAVIIEDMRQKRSRLQDPLMEWTGEIGIDSTCKSG
jgi:hypothetical protein